MLPRDSQLEIVEEILAAAGRGIEMLRRAVHEFRLQGAGQPPGEGPVSSHPRSPVLISGEMSTIFRVCAEDPTPAGARDAALLAVFYSAGLGAAQAVSLDIADYDRRTGALSVRAGRSRRGPAYVSNGALCALDDWLAVRGDDPGPLFLPTDRSGRLRLRRDDGTLRRMTVDGVHKALMRRALAAEAAQWS